MGVQSKISFLKYDGSKVLIVAAIFVISKKLTNNS